MCKVGFFPLCRTKDDFIASPTWIKNKSTELRPRVLPEVPMRDFSLTISDGTPADMSGETLL